MFFCVHFPKKNVQHQQNVQQPIKSKNFKILRQKCVWRFFMQKSIFARQIEKNLKFKKLFAMCFVMQKTEETWLLQSKSLKSFLLNKV